MTGMLLRAVLLQRRMISVRGINPSGAAVWMRKNGQRPLGAIDGDITRDDTAGYIGAGILRDEERRSCR